MKSIRISYLLIATFLVAGCDVPVEHYPPNELHALVVSTSREVPTDSAASDVTAAVESWFGSPIDPKWPGDQILSEAGKTLVDPMNLRRSAGQIYSDQQNQHFGLFREHCVTCHGVSGGGDGPASLLQNPYPRDFRAGIFKWKSTPGKVKPTRDDLMQIIINGAPGTAMPSFASVAKDDLDALVDYVVFLSVRGEFERRLISGAVDELEYGPGRPEPEFSLEGLANGKSNTEAALYAREVLNEIVNDWVQAEEAVVEVPSETPNDAESIARGRELFHGRIANCAGCHGKDGVPEDVPTDFDDWTKEFTTRLSISPSDKEAIRPFRSAGALRPRLIVPRTLSAGVFRGGAEPETLYRRFVCGIAGTPMPAVATADEASATALTAEQIWDLVHYVRDLGGVVSEGDQEQ